MPNYRHRLSRAKQKIYDRSNEITSIRLRVSPGLPAAIAALKDGLEAGDLARVQSGAQGIADGITSALEVPPVRVIVSGQRPSNTRGELHGLYSAEAQRRATIKVWMITAKRGQVVAFKTFVRTLLHEICHHLDYALLGLSDSLHTDGFYKRESSLFHQIGAARFANVRSPDIE